MSLVAVAVGAVVSFVSVPVIDATSLTGRRPEVVPGSYLVNLSHGGPSTAHAAVERLEAVRGFEAHRIFEASRAFAARMSPGQAAALSQDPNVESVVAEYRARASDHPLAAGDSAPAGVRRVEAASTSHVQGPSNARVAVLDTGIDLDHPDLNVVDGVNCVNPGTPPDDDDGHGTHVAGTIAARNNGSGVVGVAPGTPLVAVKVLDGSGQGSWSSIICGIEWVTATRTDADPSNDVAVVNMSLGGTGDPVAPCATTSDPMHRAICAGHAAGVTFVVAAGNAGWDYDYPAAPDLPAAYPEVLTVTAASDSDGRPGATGSNPGCEPNEVDDRYASFSNYARTTAAAAHTVAAPGTCIRSTWPGGGTNTISGTSMATPHVAGLVALCVSEEGSGGPCAALSPTQITERIREQSRSHRVTDPGYGFAGDPARPVEDRIYGDLVHVGITAPPAPVSAAVSPNATVVTSGSVAAGGAARLAARDGSYFAVNSTTRSVFTSAWYGRFAGVPEDLTALTVLYHGSNGRTCSQTVAVWNWSTAVWTTIDTRSVGTSATRVEKAVTGTLSNFVSDSASASGELRVRVRCTTTAGGFKARADQLRVTYTRR